MTPKRTDDGLQNAAPTGIGLALGGGSARGLAHILMLEAFDELGIKPDAIAGTSIGSIIGGLYAAGMSAQEIKAFAEDLLSQRATIFGRIASSLDGLASLWTPRAPSVVDGVTLFELLLPSCMRTSFAELKIPFYVVTSDYHDMRQVVVSHGPLIPAIAASSALPTILRPVPIEGRILIDGGFCNPTPFDVVQPFVRHVVAVDVTGTTQRRPGQDLPNAVEAWIGATQIMFRSITEARQRLTPPELLLHPEVGTFSTLDFMRFREIFAAAAPAKDELKRALARLVEEPTR